MCPDGHREVRGVVLDGLRWRWCRVGLAIVGAVVLILASGRAASASCYSTCKETLRTCRAECREQASAARRGCAERCARESACAPPGNPLRTIAYVDVECRSNGTVSSIKEALFVRRGNCDPVK